MNNYSQKIKSTWDSLRLKRIVTLGNKRTGEFLTDVRYVGLENISSWTGRLLESESVPIHRDEPDSSIVNYFEPGDVLFGKLRPYLAKAHLAYEPGVCTTELLVLKPGPKINRRFLLYSLLQREFIDLVNSSTFGSKMPRADWDFIGNIPIPFPSLVTQSVIASYLDRETTRLDSLISAKENLLVLLAEKRKALITCAVTRGLDPKVELKDSGIAWLGMIPRHWEEMHLKRILTRMDYGISESVDIEGRIIVLRMGDVSEGEIKYDNVGFVDEVDESLLLEKGDLVFNRTNSMDQIGKVGFFRGHPEYLVTFASYLVRLRCSSQVLPEFLNYLLNSSSVIAWARSQALPAIGQANLNPNRYSYLRITVPPIDEQLSIVSHIQNETSKLDSIHKATERTIGLLKERRAAVITAAVTGKMDFNLLS